MNLKGLSTSILLSSCIGYSATAANLDIRIQNLTHGITYTPLIVAAHGGSYHFFQSGTSASPSLRAMAEGGDISGLNADASAAGAVVVQNPNSGLLPPGQTTPQFSMDTGSNMYLSVAAMLLPTNDGFAGVDAWKIPTVAGNYIINVNAYDAGTEVNNELLVSGGGVPGVLGMPASPVPGGTNGTGLSDPNPNTNVHIHPGVLGDFDTTGGVSDIDARVHRWLNPVLRVFVTVK